MPATITEPAAQSTKPVLDAEKLAFQAFRQANAELFEKDDRYLLLHVATLLALISVGTYAIVATPHIWMKLLLGPVNAFFWFSLGNVTVHHLKYRANVGTDAPENLTTPCAFCHLEGEHGGRLKILPPGNAPTWLLGRHPIIKVHHRERTLLN